MADFLSLCRRELLGIKNCSMALKFSASRTKFVYDLRTGERRIKLLGADHFCDGKAVSTTSGTDESAEAMRRYFSKVNFEDALGISSPRLPRPLTFPQRQE